MPLVKRADKKAFEQNIREMIKSGHKTNQAVAAAYSVKREANNKHK